MSYIDDLIPIYAKHPVAEVKAQPRFIEGAFGRPLSELALLPGFSKDQEFVESLKSQIEDHKAEFETADKKVQIGKCLRSLFNFVLFDKAELSTVNLKVETARRLFVEIYAETNWSVSQRRHFDFVCERLKEWNSYFLSYTNQGGKIVNVKYKAVIDVYTAPDVLAKRDRDQHNILADAIVNCLRRRLLVRRSFYDKDNIGAGDNLDDKITPAASKTFAFVQLVQLETFDVSREVNWSYKEYQIFHKHNELELNGRDEYRQVFKKRFAAILAGERGDLQLSLIPWDYELWFNRIFGEKHFLTLPLQSDLFEDTMKQLADAIVNVTLQIIDNVPS